jgi:hypothetical protein
MALPHMVWDASVEHDASNTHADGVWCDYYSQVNVSNS